jgi:hypothetical protein
VICTSPTNSREALKGAVTCNKGFYFLSGPESDTCEGVQRKTARGISIGSQGSRFLDPSLLSTTRYDLSVPSTNPAACKPIPNGSGPVVCTSATNTKADTGSGEFSCATGHYLVRGSTASDPDSCVRMCRQENSTGLFGLLVPGGLVGVNGHHFRFCIILGEALKANLSTYAAPM